MCSLGVVPPRRADERKGRQALEAGVMASLLAWPDALQKKNEDWKLINDRRRKIELKVKENDVVEEEECRGEKWRKAGEKM